MSDPAQPGPLPELTFVPQQLSAEHHLLRRLSDEQPATLGQVLRKIREKYPAYTALGADPEHPTASARNAWARITAEGWARPAPSGMGHGLLLTGHGEVRLAELFRSQVVMPWLRATQASHGRAAAEQALEALERGAGQR